MEENNNKILLKIEKVDDEHTTFESNIRSEQEAQICMGVMARAAMKDAGLRHLLTYVMNLLLNMAEYKQDMLGNDIDASKIINDLEQDINNEKPSRA